MFLLQTSLVEIWRCFSVTLAGRWPFFMTGLLCFAAVAYKLFTSLQSHAMEQGDGRTEGIMGTECCQKEVQGRNRCCAKRQNVRSCRQKVVLGSSGLTVELYQLIGPSMLKENCAVAELSLLYGGH